LTSTTCQAHLDPARNAADCRADRTTDDAANWPRGLAASLRALLGLLTCALLSAADDILHVGHNRHAKTAKTASHYIFMNVLLQ